MCVFFVKTTNEFFHRVVNHVSLFSNVVDVVNRRHLTLFDATRRHSTEPVTLGDFVIIFLFIQAKRGPTMP